jgi:hypothetical protein
VARRSLRPLAITKSATPSRRDIQRHDPGHDHGDPKPLQDTRPLLQYQDADKRHACGPATGPDRICDGTFSDNAGSDDVGEATG